jgi:phosphatidylserine/phosphatidylglycerophosphate/cardiolipin synthase-like enzyme
VTEVQDDVARYLPPSTPECPNFVNDTEWHPLLDGAAYLGELAQLFARAGSGDSVWLAGLELDPAIDLHGRAPDDPQYRPLGELLAGLAARGVDVRVLLASRVLASSIPGTVVGGFRATALRAEALRALRPEGSEPARRPPLAGRVVLDYSGLLLGSNHQKVVVAHIAGELTAFVGGIDLVADRFDVTPHDRLTLNGRRWGWHDLAVRLRGRAADRVWDVFGSRWYEAAALPRRHFLTRPFTPAALNPERPVPPPAPAPGSPAVPVDSTTVRVLRSRSARKLDSVLPWRRVAWLTPPDEIVHEVFDTYVSALTAARRFVYLEDQYLGEANLALGGNADFELYGHLRAAAARGVKVILVGSGTRDPEDTGVHLRPINRRLNRDLRTKIVEPLSAAARGNVAVYRVDNVTVHAKLLIVDDAFAAIGSANVFSRSMAGTDSELTSAVATTTTLVRDLRVEVWADHLRAPLTPALRGSLEDLDLALGIWRGGWGTDPGAWRAAGQPAGFAPRDRVLRLVGP